ncbi:alpha beta protein [Diplodia corticola]|uniref:Alpha beta protein n=1 Tax=Diplodia corticola TaxID=236234 RepID=A0A1J9R4D4_9PEZI|nr:alpha beta protein [Diplodia corticola]OJD35464.1 alpha beta protein [Diplodia corticola]
MPTPGILYVGAAIKDPVLDEATLNKWYDETHVPEMFALRNGPPAAFRFKNTDSTRPFRYLCLYVLPDLAWADSDDLKGATLTHDALPSGRSYLELLDWDLRHYEKIQTFEGQNPKPDGARVGSCVIAVAMEPAAATADSDDPEHDLDAWYRLQHLDMLSTVKGYRRSTRYKLRSAVPATADAAARKLAVDELPRYLALHEYDSQDVPPEQIKLAVNTEWSKKVIGGARAFVRDVWLLTSEAGDAATKL